MGKLNLKFVIQAALIIGMVTIAAIVIYVLQNESGHMAIDPYTVLVVFIPVLLVGIAGSVILKSQCLPIMPGVLTITVGCIGILLLLYIDWTDTLLQYEVWLQRGMP